MKIKVQTLVSVSSIGGFDECPDAMEEALASFKEDFKHQVAKGVKFSQIRFLETDSSNIRHAQACFEAVMEGDDQVIGDFIQELKNSGDFEEDMVVE